MTDFGFQKLDLEGAYLIQDFYRGDSRGGFTKCFEEEIFRQAGISFDLSETFFSKSCAGVIRGMHFQLNHPQAKLVSVPKGSVYDVIVDLRWGSRSFGKWRGYELSGENHLALYVPRGFAHGFASLEDDTLMLYQCDGAYDKETDTGIRFDDPDLNISWPVELKGAVHSKRDLELMSFAEYVRIAGR